MKLNSIQAAAEDKYPLDDPRKNMHHDNYGQYSRRDAFLAGHTYTMEAYGVEEMAKALRELVEYYTGENKTWPNMPTDKAKAALDKYDLMDGKK